MLVGFRKWKAQKWYVTNYWKPGNQRLNRNMLYFQVAVSRFDISWFWQTFAQEQTFHPLESIVSGGATGSSAYRINIQCERVRPMYIVSSREPVVGQPQSSGSQFHRKADSINISGSLLLIASWFSTKWTLGFHYCCHYVMRLEDKRKLFLINTKNQKQHNILSRMQKCFWKIFRVLMLHGYC